MELRTLPDATAYPVRPAKLAHVVLRVSDLPRSRAWYLEVLQAWPAFENEMLSFLTYDDEHHRIGLIARPNLGCADDESSGLEHVAFTYATLDRLLATFRRLKRTGIVPYWTINHGPTLSLYYKDPDGNRVELQYDVFAREEDVQAFFGSGAYVENFMGIRFDPEVLIARYEAGEPLASLTARPALPPGKSPWDMLVT
jgi:catechol 2,3-dioxygenase-like lactoylglutathione lyase family enzyme